MSSVEHYKWVQKNVVVICVFDGNPSFQYTVGLWQQGLPELIITGLDGTRGGTILNLVAAHMHEHGEFKIGDLDRDIFNMPALFGAVSINNLTEYMQQALNAVRQRPARDALQVIWPDAAGLFPGEPGCSADVVRYQKLLA